MAEKDITEKLLTDIDEVFADIYNNLCFNGENIIKPDDLTNASVTSAFISNDDDANLLANNQDDFARAIARGITDYVATL